MRELTLSASSTESKRSNLMALCVALLLFVTGALIAVNLAQPTAYAAAASTAVTTYRERAPGAPAARSASIPAWSGSAWASTS
jgi:hypothetical protein